MRERNGTRETGNRKNLDRDRKLDRSGIHRALVPKENGGARSARLVRATFRDGRSEFDFLFSSGLANGRALVRDDAEQFHFRCKAASVVFVSLDESEIAAATISTPCPGRC